MTRAQDKAARDARRAAMLDAVRAEPGLSAYELSLRVPAGPGPPPDDGALLPRPAPAVISTGEALALLRRLERDGLVRHDAPPAAGWKWHPAGPPP